MSLIVKEIKEKVGLITFNYPRKRNALNVELVEQLVHAFQDFQNRE